MQALDIAGVALDLWPPRVGGEDFMAWLLAKAGVSASMIRAQTKLHQPATEPGRGLPENG